MPVTQTCPKCGAELPPDAPSGFCPKCLFRLGAAEALEGPPAKAPSSPAGPPPPGAELASGPLRSFGDYELLEEIARGGMGVVYRARQISLNRLVAVKMILGGALATPDFVRRFRTEASAAAVLHHPNIVAIHEVGVQAGQHYFSMEFVDGPNLAKLVGHQPLAASRAARYVKLVAEAVHHAHQQGILHRDLKPSNVLIDSNDQPRITDFGLAKRLDTESSLTLSGQVLGSPNFMPPEQARGKGGKVGRHSDIYGLGGILYYLLTARAPFQADSLEAIVSQVLNAEPVSPRLLNATVPRDVETICLKCLEKDPRRRYATAQELADELGRFLEGRPILARAIGASGKVWRWCRRKPVVASLAATSVLVFGLGLGGIVWQWRRVEAQRQQTEHALIRSEEQQYAAHVALAQNLMEQRHFDRARALLEEDSLSRYRGWEWGWLQRQCHQDLATLNHPVAVTSLAFSPDGRYLVTGSFDRLVRLWNWEEGKVERVFQGHEDHAGVWPGSFSPDGKRLVSMSWDRTARIWDVASGRELLRLAHPVALDGAQFSPDGTTVATGGWDGVVRVWNAETGEQLRQATNGDSVLFVAFSPDGRRIAYAGGPRFSTEVGHDTAVKIWDLATDHKQALLGHRVTVMCVAFSPDGKTLASGSFDGAVKLWDVATGRELPAVNTGFSYRIVFTLAFSPDGQQLAVGGMQGLTPRAEIFNLASRERVRTLEGHSVGVRSVAFSPDGSQIATASFGDQVRVWATTNEPDYLSLEGHNAAVWAVACSGDSRRIATGSFDKTVKIWDAESGSLIQTIPVGLPVLSLALSADGKRLVTPAPEANATVWDVAGGQPLLTLKGHSKTVMAVALSTDGRWIVTGSKDNTVRLWNTTNGVFLRAFPGHSNWVLSVAFSPDGQRVLTGSADRTAIIWDTESGRRLQTLAGHSDRVLSVAYSPDGQRVATGSSGGERKVRLWDVHTGAVFWQVEHMDGVTGLAFSPDGTRLARAAGSATRDDTFMKEFSVAITDVRTGYELLQLAGHSNCVASVAFSPDGTRLVTGSGDNTARIRTASPWQEERVAGQTTPSLTDRFERYKRQQRRARLPASNQVTAATVSRTNVFAFCGEVSMPGQRVPKTRPMLPIPARDARAGHQQIDLSVTYNATLAETWQPVTELRHVDWSLAALPRGLQVFGGIQFDLRGLIQLGRAAPDWEWPTYPEQVRITVGQKFNRLHVLHGSSYSTSEGATIGTYRLRYADGSEHVLDIVYGRDLAYWVGPADAKLSEGEAGQAEVAWTGEDPSREPGKEPRSLRLFRRTYQNPHPEIEVARIDFDSAMSKCGPFLVAMTVE